LAAIWSTGIVQPDDMEISPVRSSIVCKASFHGKLEIMTRLTSTMKQEKHFSTAPIKLALRDSRLYPEIHFAEFVEVGHVFVQINTDSDATDRTRFDKDGFELESPGTETAFVNHLSRARNSDLFSKRFYKVSHISILIHRNLSSREINQIKIM
jgi:hypothetical protein